MKERKAFITKVNQVHERHTNAIIIAVIVVIAIALFIAGYLVSWNFLCKPLNDNQLEAYEQVARDVYAQKGLAIVESSEDSDFSISMTAATITVESANVLCRGKVIAKLQNGELAITRDMETAEAILISVVIGMMFVGGAVCIIGIMDAKGIIDIIGIINSIHEKLNK